MNSLKLEHSTSGNRIGDIIHQLIPLKSLNKPPTLLKGPDLWHELISQVVWICLGKLQRVAVEWAGWAAAV